MAKTQTLSFPIRLPDAMQAEALRLLDASREPINQIVTELWQQLDLFTADRAGPAWKQVEKHVLRRSGHGSRQERCEMEQAGRILRAQASRKQVFQTILPLLSEGLIRPAEGQRPARKEHRQIKEQVRALRARMHDAGEEADAFMSVTWPVARNTSAPRSRSNCAPQTKKASGPGDSGVKPSLSPRRCAGICGRGASPRLPPCGKSGAMTAAAWPSWMSSWKSRHATSLPWSKRAGS